MRSREGPRGGVIDVFIVDPHPVVCRGLELMLGEAEGVRVVGTARHPRGLLNGGNPPGADVVFLAIGSLAAQGLSVLERLKARWPDLPVLVFSGLDEETFGPRALGVGADGYVHKRASAQEVAAAVRRVAAGGRYVSVAVGERLASAVRNGQGGCPHEALSAREFQVLLALGQGHRVRDIAEELGLSPKTVSTYRTRILEKLGLRTTAELTGYVIREGLFPG